MQPCIATAPSNIAFLKYWGKVPDKQQWPATHSLSMTLKGSVSETRVTAATEVYDQISLNGSSAPAAGKIIKFLDFLREQLGSSRFYSVSSQNSFPTACGIASSASGYAALTLAVAGYETQSSSLAELVEKGFALDQLADWARVGSGSACRSFWGGFVGWLPGVGELPPKTQPIAAPSALELADTILLLNANPKETSSSAGHQTAWSSPLFLPRVAGSAEIYQKFLQALNAGDLEQLGFLMEQEALAMHAVMLSSNPSQQYFTQATSDFCGWLRTQRQQGKLEAWFTIDAGPNVHIISSQAIRPGLLKALQDSPFAKFSLIEDSVGQGPEICLGPTLARNLPTEVATS